MGHMPDTGKTGNMGAFLYGARDLRVHSCPEVEKLGPKEVRVQGLYVGVCGSDLHLFQDAEMGHFHLTKPYILGHEGIARVLELGSEVTALQVGDVVAMEPATPCDACSFCRSGHYNWCETCNYRQKGMPGEDLSICNGFLQKYFTHPADFCYKIPKGVDLKIGALCEPLAVCVHAGQRAQLTVNQRVLVTGAGTMGLLSMLVARAHGATTVIVADIQQSRLDIAKKLGADHTILLDKKTDPTETGKRIKAECGGPVDAVMECSGAEPCHIMAVEVCGYGGKIIAIGIGPPLIRFPMSAASFKEVDVLTVCRLDAGCFDQAVQFLFKYKDVLPLLVTHVFPLEEIAQALKTMETGEGVKFMIDVENAGSKRDPPSG